MTHNRAASSASSMNSLNNTQGIGAYRPMRACRNPNWKPIDFLPTKSTNNFIKKALKLTTGPGFGRGIGATELDRNSLFIFAAKQHDFKCSKEG